MADKPKEHKLDIFDLLAAVDRRDRRFLSRQPADAQKGFSPRVALRWASAVTGPAAEQYMLLTNEIANVQFDDLRDHPELQYMLLAACGAGRKQKHEWLPMPKQGKSAAKVQSFLARFHPLASVEEIDLLVSMHTRETFTDLVHQSGCTPQEAKDLLNAFDAKNGKPVKKGKGET